MVFKTHDSYHRGRTLGGPTRLRTCDFYALGAVGIQDIFV